MGEALRLAFGIMGNAASLLLYAAPILTFKRVIKKRSTEGFSCIPYVLALFNSLLYTWYGLPVVSTGWENFPLITINAFGVLLESAFVIIYFWFVTVDKKKMVGLMTAVVVAAFSTTMFVSSFALQDHKHRKLLVGFVGLVASVSMYASPLGVMRQVVRTKSVEFMPFYLSFFSFLASSLWMFYGLLSHDILLATPNLVGSPLSMLQLVVYCMYREKKGIGHEEANMGVEKNDLQLKGIQPAVIISAASSIDQIAMPNTNV